MSIIKKPLSDARLAANRANALKSTGPRTPSGKARSSQNALTHGLTASLSSSLDTPSRLGRVKPPEAGLTASLPTHGLTASPSAPSPRDLTALGEDSSLLPATLQSFLASWNPQSPYEASLVEDLATLRLRLKRCVRMESGLLDTEIPAIAPSDSHERVNAALGASFSEQQANLSRAYDRTLKQLLAVRKAGLTPVDGPPATPDAATSTPAPAPKLDETNPPPFENKQPLAAPPADEPSIRTQRNPPAAPEDPVNRRHGQLTPLPPRQHPEVQLVWIRKDENGNDVEYDM